MAADNSLVKKPHTQQHFTEQQIHEFIKCSDPDTGYLYFMTNYFYIQHPVKGKLLFDPFEYQLGLLESYHQCRLSVNMMPRQSGKCLKSNTNIKIRNNKTGEIREIPIGEFYEMQKNITSDNDDML